VFCLSVMLLLDICTGVLSEISSLGKARLRRIKNEPYSTSSSPGETMSPEIGNEEQDVVESHMERDRNARNALQAAPLDNSPILVKTFVHVVYSTTDLRTNVTKEVIDEQMLVLNNAFKGNLTSYTDCGDNFKKYGIEIPFHFDVQTIDRTPLNYWHSTALSKDSDLAKQLRTGTCADLHIFIAGGDVSFGYHGEQEYQIALMSLPGNLIQSIYLGVF